MTYPKAVNVVKHWLIQHKNISNQKVLELVNGDQDLQRLVLEALRTQGYAETDQHLGLRWTGQFYPKQDIVYDVFISYARKDNKERRIDEVINEVGKRYLNYGKVLNIFFDLPELKIGDFWWEKIKDAIRHSKVFIAIISPSYLESKVCRLEWNEFVSHQLDWYKANEDLLSGQDSIIPSFIIKMPEMMNLPLEQLPEWQRDIRQRNIMDLSDWFEEGQAALKRENIRHKFDEISNRCYRKLQDAERLKNIRSTLPPFFKELVRRRDLIKQIKDSLDKSEYPVTGLFGLPGMGKSTVAFSYAKEFQSRYIGGCWYIPASGNLNFRERLIQVAGLDWEIQFTEEERKDIELAWRSVKHFLENPLKQNKKHLTLLIFDNVDSPEESFSDAEVDKNLLNGTHILITSRRQVNHCHRSEWVAVEGLDDNESMDMLNRYRPFNSTEEKLAAASIVKELNGFALALTIIGVQVSSNINTDFKDVIEDLKSGNIIFLDYTGNQIEDLPGHYEQKVMTLLFNPLLERLAEHELRVLDYAALMPPDSIALPWLEELVTEEFPENFPTPKFKSELSAWEKLVRKFKGMSLFSDTPSVNVARIHRLLQEVITQNRQVQQQEIENKLQKLLINKAKLLNNSPHIKTTKWQVPVLRAFASNSIIEDTTKGIFLDRLSLIERELGNYNAAKEWMKKAIGINEKNYGPNHLRLGIDYSNMALIEGDIGNYQVAREWMKKAISIAEKNYDPGHHELGAVYSNMALIERVPGNYSNARKWMKKAISIAEKNYDPGHHELGAPYSNMALIEQDLSNYSDARKWMKKAIEIAEKNYDPGHLSLGIIYSNMALIEQGLGNYQVAKEWMKKAINIAEKNYDPGHPRLGTFYSNIAMIDRNLGNCSDVKEWIKKAIEIDEKNYEPNHPSFGTNYSLMAIIERDLGNYNAAKEWMKKAIGINEKNYEPNHSQLGTDYSNMALIERDLSNHFKARKWMKKAVDIAKKNYEPGHPSLGMSYHNLAGIELDNKNPEWACKLWLKAYSIFFNSLGENHPYTKTTLKYLQENCPDCF